MEKRFVIELMCSDMLIGDPYRSEWPFTDETEEEVLRTIYPLYESWKEQPELVYVTLYRVVEETIEEYKP
jgi:hypothetical protein